MSDKQGRILTAARLNDLNICPGCGIQLGSRRTFIPVPTMEKEKYKFNQLWYCSSCGNKLFHAYSFRQIFFGIKCSSCGHRIHLQQNLALVNGKFCCWRCRDELVNNDAKLQDIAFNNHPDTQIVNRPAAPSHGTTNKSTPKVHSKPASKKDDIRNACVFIRRPASHGDAELSNLELHIKNNHPSVLWAVTWRGGYSHADGAGSDVMIPYSVLYDLTPESLIAWLNQRNASVVEMIDRNAFVNDSKVIAWCKEIRDIYSQQRIPVQPNGKLVIPKHYRELFVVYQPDQSYYTSLILDTDHRTFHLAHNRMIHQGGMMGFAIEEISDPLTTEEVRGEAHKTFDRERGKIADDAIPYMNISDEPIDDILQGRIKHEQPLASATTAEELRQCFCNLLSNRDTELLQFVTFHKDGVDAGLFPSGIPYIRRDAGHWYVAVAYDDMRGPQGHNCVTLNQAMRIFISSTKYHHHLIEQTKKT